jgi:hypothetical protein
MSLGFEGGALSPGFPPCAFLLGQSKTSLQTSEDAPKQRAKIHHLAA